MKRKTFKKLSGLILSLLLVIAMLPATAFAQTEEIDFGNLIESNSLKPVDASVILGDNIDRTELTDEIELEEFELLDEPTIYIDPLNEEIREVPPINDDDKKISTRAIGNNTPNTAINIAPYFSNLLEMPATNNEDWYYFQVERDKITVVFSQENDGQYALVLYRMNSNGTLSQVASSANSGTFQKLDYLCMRGDTFYLRVLPLTPPTTSYNYTFEVYNSYFYREIYELNEFPETARPFTSELENVFGEIDNPFDDDWYKLTVTKQTDYDITASYYSKNSLAVFLYDSNLNSKGSFYIDNTTRAIVLDAGVYYLRVMSANGIYLPNECYRLKMIEYTQPITTITIPTQNFEPYFLNSATYELASLAYDTGNRIDFEMEYTILDDSGEDNAAIVRVYLKRDYGWEEVEELPILWSPVSHILDYSYEGRIVLILESFKDMDASMKIRLLPH